MVEKHKALSGIAQGDQWTTWTVQKALPLWARAGYDRKRHLYHERLTFDAAPIEMPDLRVMVQARQIATFCRAALDGVFDASHDALACLSEVQGRYWRSDDQPGWVFALGPDGRPSKTTRDLYAHAFILFAYAWAYRLSGDRKLIEVVNETISEIENIFQAPGGGFWDAVPAPDNIRRQNPHMHLLEAYLVLFEVTEDQFYMEKAQQLITLAREKFISSGSGMLLEFFDTDWTPCKALGHNSVEPGHLFEWSWLLGEATRLNPEENDHEGMCSTVERLFAAGVQYGILNGLVCDSITDRGTMAQMSTRIWPQTELMRLLMCRKKMSVKNPLNRQEDDLLFSVTKKFFAEYAPETLQGGWIDRRAADGTITVDHMPASSLYHIYGSAREFFRPTGRL
ncbi:AGE family epimerase/isomerase [Neokomagataea thailandica]|uniref:AGE family epimerase/isomerase n=1 Tax=Neokomagataea TaxID=1223423 RepID=UPI001FDF1CA1|nr:MULTISPECIES: AGE family epimerase/isomerase [Neokomagataea]